MDDGEVLKKRGYTLGIHLGEGMYAKVKCAYSELLEANVAIKIIDRRKAPADFQKKFLPRELEILALLRHRYVIRTYEIFETSDGKIYIVMELGEQGDLLDFIKARGALPEQMARTMFRQLALAVQYCHEMDVVHRDLKCENILLDKDFNIKLSDFGFSKRCVTDDLGRPLLSKTFCGSPAYAAPEIIQAIPYHPKVCDIWSLGVILFVMVCGSMPYNDTHIKKMLRLQKEHRVDFPHSAPVPGDCRDLIYRMLHPTMRKRLTIGEVLEHAWLISTRKMSKTVEATLEKYGQQRDEESKSEILPQEKAKGSMYQHQVAVESEHKEGTKMDLKLDEFRSEAETSGKIMVQTIEPKTSRHKSRILRVKNQDQPDDIEVYPDQENFIDAVRKAKQNKSKPVGKKGKRLKKYNY
ncbi:testis-specific serine/threonine-protein kinase 1-like [Narcine bancroftii]|uniref:testis-specific serine/threonine-protein kinase 1-like n=1 Tax=Narcine bancroftii TaxID=1343680 RepID=UPI003831C7BE